MVTVCPFNKFMHYTQYSDFKQGCVTKQLKIDIIDDEYIDIVDNSDSGEILVTVLSRQDPLFKRQVWLYSSSTIVPVLDFTTYAYAVSSVWRFEFKRSIITQEDLVFNVYSTVAAASYILRNPTENLIKKTQKAAFGLEDQSLKIVASDEDNSVEVEFDVTFKEEFFTQLIDTVDVNLNFDE